MNLKMITRIQAYILEIEAVLMIPPLIIALWTKDRPATLGFIVAIAVAVIAGGIIFLVTKGATRKFYAKEGMAATGFAWVIMSLDGCLPFFISRRIPNFIDCFFETVSGFTTTGASIVPKVEALGKGLLYWRSFTHWVGGMGILVFFLAVVPISGRDKGFTLHLLRAESPGPEVNKMVPKMRQSAGISYILYCILTVLDVIFLLIGKMPLFDALCIAYGTAGTGGFSVLSSGCASYTPFAQWVTTIFMLAFGVNFSLYYLMTIHHFKAVAKDEELRLYLSIVLISTALIAINVFGRTVDTSHLGPTIRHAAFQVASIITTTGYATTDFNKWPALSKSILLFLMFAGACAGSTGGGIKNIRLVILFKSFRRNIHQVMHPHEVSVVRVNHSRVSEQTISNVNAYLVIYVMIVIASVLLISADPGNFSFETNFSAIMATFNNIGPGLGKVGPTSNFSCYNNFSTLIMSFDMLLGRLEIYPILALFVPSLYKKSGRF